MGEVFCRATGGWEPESCELRSTNCELFPSSFGNSGWVYKDIWLPTNISGETRPYGKYMHVKTGGANGNSQSFPALLPFYPYTSNYKFPIADQEN
ncbi:MULTISPECIES: hypothetical protein [unclassified Microcoleus]|uniref:hypothetical protein n=1 Tax=unclassified Microcoleus TaxID=2642155 RepID=UPI002FCF8BC7